jgi:flagellar hook-length control protein FliK
MNVSVNSCAVSPSCGDVRGDELAQWTSKKPQGRFVDIPILADVQEQTRSDSKTADETDPGTAEPGERDTATARKRAGRSGSEDSPVGTAAMASDTPAESSVRTKEGIRKGDSTSARSSKTPCEQLVAAGSSETGRKKQATTLSPSGKNGQSTHTEDCVAGKDGGLGARRRILLSESPTKSEGTLRGSGSENRMHAGSRRGGASGSQGLTVEALLSEGRETQPGSHKSGASVPPPPSACFVNQPAATGMHNSLGTAVLENANAGVNESASASVGEQILDSLKASMAQGDGQILIRLQPPELGMVLVRFREQEQGLDGTLRVDRTETRHEIAQALPDVLRSLQEAGIGIRRLEVTNGDSPGSDLGQGQLPQEGSSGRPDAGQDQGHLWAASTSWSSAAADFAAESQVMPDFPGSAPMPSGRIDMLL